MSKLKTQIVKLREQGKSYNKISEILDCSKSVISYHLNDKVKQRNKLRHKKYRTSKKGKIYTKIDTFFSKSKSDDLNENKEWMTYVPREKKHDILYEKILNNPVCYITGKPINLNDMSSYSLDHIVPRSKGGQNTIENAGLCISIINKMKSNLTLSEFKDYCKLVLDYNK